MAVTCGVSVCSTSTTQYHHLPADCSNQKPSAWRRVLTCLITVHQYGTDKEGRQKQRSTG